MHSKQTSLGIKMDLPLLNQNFQDFFEKNTSVMLLIDPDNGNILDANSSASKFYGYKKNELLEMKISEINLLSPEKIKEELQLAILEKRNYFKFQHRLANDEIKNVEVHSTPMSTNSGKFLFSIIHDVTDRMKAEDKVISLLDEKEILLREVHHRIKNNMSTIHSLLDLQMNSLDDKIAISALKDAASRIQSMAMLYDKLYLTKNYQKISLSEYITSLSEQIISNFPNNSFITLKVEVEEIHFEANSLQYLGIIINEIFTNIMKYAFSPNEAGEIYVHGFEKLDHYHLIIKDNGKGMPESIDFEKPVGFGLSLIQFLSKRLEMSISIERKNGTSLHFIIPIKNS